MNEFTDNLNLANDAEPFVSSKDHTEHEVTVPGAKNIYQQIGRLVEYHSTISKAS